MSGERGDGGLTYEKAGLFGLSLAEFALLLDDQVKETLCQHMLAPEELMRVESLYKFKVALEICTKNMLPDLRPIVRLGMKRQRAC